MEKKFDIAAFIALKHHSVLYRYFLSREGLHKALDEAIDKGANIFSIRLVED